MSNIYVTETYVNRSEGYRYGETEPYETFTAHVGTLFRAMRSEFGRCVGKVYVDLPRGTIAIGWVFQKRVTYEGSKDTYLQETWVTLWRPTGSAFDNLALAYDYLPLRS